VILTNDRPVLPSEGAPHGQNRNCLRVTNTYSWAPEWGSTLRQTDSSLTLIFNLHTFQRWSWRHHTSPKRRDPSKILHGVIAQKIIMWNWECWFCSNSMVFNIILLSHKSRSRQKLMQKGITTTATLSTGDFVFGSLQSNLEGTIPVTQWKFWCLFMYFSMITRFWL
jgi:hypothetical protein